MKRIQILIVALGLLMLASVPLSGQHFVPVYQSLYQPMNIIVSAATIDGVDLEAGDEIGIFDTTATGEEICVGYIMLTGPIISGNPLPIVASTDDPLTTDQDGFLDGNPILYRIWDASESMELICVTMTYDLGFDIVFTSLGTALGSLEGIISPTVDAGADDETCGDTPYTLSGSATNQDYVEWTTSGDGTFDDASSLTAIYTPGSTDISNGTVTLTLTAFAVSPCGDHASDDMVLGIQASPTAIAGADDATCEDMPYTLIGSATNQSSVEWTTSGDGTFDDPTLLDATYTPGSGDISNGAVTLTLTAFAILPCTNDASDEMILSIQALPTAYAGANAEICEDVTYTLSGFATHYASTLWTTSGDGTFDDATLLNATYTPGNGDISNGSVTLTLTANAISPCGSNVDDSMDLSIQPLPTATAGPDAGICEGETYTLSGAATNQESVNWTTAGDGTFDDASLLNATYTPGSGDISNGTVVLIIAVTSIAPCSAIVTDAMMLSIDPIPETPDTPTGPVEVDIHFTPTSQYETQSTPGANTYLWTLSPLTAGNIVGTVLTSTVTWNAAYHGLAYVKVFAINNCGAVASDSLEINVYNSVGVWESNSNEMNVQIIPNPNRGSFKLNITGMEKKLDIAIFSSDGGLIESHTLNNDGDIEMEFNLTDLPKGLYFIRLYNDRTNLIEKVIIQ
ncbi:MAG: T9SS type A sorting domain-containing protein [Bacteroidales bacterium]|nr:T9SS type A sorting domain-containing protein [Bacteroidales bacterium]